MNNRAQASTASWLNVLAGAWLIIAPFVLHYTNATTRTNDILIGVIVAVLALFRGAIPSKNTWLSWVNLILGLWLIVAPFILGYANTTPRWNDVIMGLIVGGLAAWSAYSTSHEVHV